MTAANKLMMKFQRLIFTLFFTVVFLFILSAANYDRKQEDLILISNNYYSEYHKTIYDSNIERWMKLEPDVGCRLFIEYNDMIHIFLGGGSWHLPCAEGSFFSEDIKSGQAVIGKNVLQNTKSEGGRRFLTVFGQDYEVTGVLGADFSSKSDSLVLLNNIQIPKQDRYKMIIDGDSERAVRKQTDKIRKEFGGLTAGESRMEGMVSLTGTLLFQRLLHANMMVLAAGAMVSFMIFWNRVKAPEFYVLSMLGIPGRRICALFLAEAVWRQLLALIIGLLLYLCVAKDSRALFQKEYIMLLSGGMIAGSCFLYFLAGRTGSCVRRNDAD